MDAALVPDTLLGPEGSGVQLEPHGRLTGRTSSLDEPPRIARQAPTHDEVPTVC